MVAVGGAVFYKCGLSLMTQFFKFLIAGLLNSSIGYSIIFFCMYLLGVSAVVSNIIGYLCGLIISYALNRHFIFKSTSKSRIEIVRFLFVFLVAYVFNLGMLLVLIQYVKINEGLAQVFAGSVYVLTTFIMNKYYVFRNHLRSNFLNTNLSKKGPLFLFFGYGSEYTLHDLFVYMKGKGDDCLEIDMLTHEDVVGALKALLDKEIVLMTSAHLLYDDKNFFFYKSHRKIVSVLHIISTLKPRLSVYYPHDLNDPIKVEEIPYLPLFDLFLSPLENLKYLEKYLPVVPVGWIKCQPKTKRVMPEKFNVSRAVFFTGAYQFYLKQGFDVFYETYKPLFDAGVAVKFPKWNENHLFESFLRERGVNVYPSEANSIHVMEENDIIYTQALSSVNIEACALGKRVCYIKNLFLDGKVPEVELKDVGTITYVDSPAEAASLPKEELTANMRSMCFFDFVAAREAVWDYYFIKSKLQHD